MSYDPTLLTVRDRIRKMIGDTDVDAEFFPDATYDAELAQAGAAWKIAAASMAESLAVVLENRVSSFTAPGDLAVSWSGRTTTLRSLAARLRAEAEADAGTGDALVTSVQLTRGGSSESEYRPSDYYRRLRRYR